MATRDRNNNNVDSSDQDGKRRSLFTSITPNSADLDGRRGSRQIHVISNWTTFDEQPLSGESIAELFSNTIPVVRYPKLFSTEECAKLVDIIKTAHVGTYNQKVIFPPVGTVGISQFDYPNKKIEYLSDRTSALALQDRFINEARVDVVGRVMNVLEKVTGLRVRMAQEGARKYFAGLLRVVDNTVQIHADFAPHDCQGWEIGHIAAQLTWNTLLATVPGGETIIYDRQWQGVADDSVFRKPLPSYAYSPTGLQGSLFKVMAPVEGDVTFFNSRNFHEVKPCDRTVEGPKEVMRLTMSSFIGLLEGKAGRELVLWS